MDDRIGNRGGGLAMSGFESFAGAAAIPATARMECKVCWHVYDPDVGDAVWQIPAGTPFAQLPPHWTCPDCSAPAAQFLRLGDD